MKWRSPTIPTSIFMKYELPNHMQLHVVDSKRRKKKKKKRESPFLVILPKVEGQRCNHVCPIGSYI